MTNREDEREQDYQQGYEQGFQIGASEVVAELENWLGYDVVGNRLAEFIMLLRKKEILKQWK